MSEVNDPGPSSRQNPLIWIALIVIGLILFLFLSGERGDSKIVGAPDDSAGEIERSLLVPPGMRARQYIEQIRERGHPYPLPEVFDKADRYLLEGSLADAHLLYFFAAREDHLPAIMKMAEMSDPTRFQAANSLLDHADVIQAYKWYQKAADMGHADAGARLVTLQQWARSDAQADNPHARQLLLNFQ